MVSRKYSLTLLGVLILLPLSLHSQLSAAAAGTISWVQRASMPTARGALAVATAGNGKIYAAGGYNVINQVVRYATVEEYDPATDTWRTRASLSRPHSATAAVAANGTLLVISGDDDSGLIPTVEAYNPVSDAWSAQADIPTARSGLAAAVASNGKVYAVGGSCNCPMFTAVSTVEEYNPSVNTWRSRAP